MVTPAGQQTRAHETDLSAGDLAAAADVAYRPADIGAAIASGSFRTAGMIVAPCSIRTLSAIAYGNGDNLLTHRRTGAGPCSASTVEDDVDITDPAQVVWVFATCSRPDLDRGEFHFPPELSMQLAVYLTEEESRSFRAGKVIYNCLLADLHPQGRRPVKGSFENGWPAEIQERVLKNWHDYGY